MKRIRSFVAFTILALAGIERSDIHAFNVQNAPQASDESVKIYSLGKEENDSFDAAMQESDPKKRAAKLYEFIQKYPQSPLIRWISNEAYEGIRLIENEYNDFYSARQEPDLAKRAAMLLEFEKKHPDSAFKAQAENDYIGILKSLRQDKNYELEYSLGEQWLAARPNDTNTLALVGEAASQLKKYQRCGECLEAVYDKNPSPNLAHEIQTCYRKANNWEKIGEWAEILFQMPEFKDDFLLRYEYALIYYNERNLPKAADYAKLALKSVDRIKLSDEKQLEQLQQVHRACHHIIATSLADKGHYSEAISEYEQAIEVKKYSDGYYGIGRCFDNTKNIEEAMLYYAAADLMNGDKDPKAKERLEVLYKALHNDTLIGIDKIYSKARKLLEDQST